MRAAENITMPFGKFKGQKLSEIRNWYLRWALENLSAMRPALVNAIESELQYREAKKAQQVE
jgi:hypothetical protein